MSSYLSSNAPSDLPVNLFDGLNKIEFQTDPITRQTSEIDLKDVETAKQGILALKRMNNAKEATKSFNDQIKSKIKDLNTAFKKIKVTKDSVEKVEKKESKLHSEIFELKKRQYTIARSLNSLSRDQKEITVYSARIKKILDKETPARNEPVKTNNKQSESAIKSKINEYEQLEQKVRELKNSSEQLQAEKEKATSEIQKFRTSWENVKGNLENLNQAVSPEDIKNNFSSLKDLDKANQKISQLMKEVGEISKGKRGGVLGAISHLKQRFESVVGREIFALSLKVNVEDKLNKLKEIKRELSHIDPSEVSSKIQASLKDFDQRLSHAIRKVSGQGVNQADTDRETEEEEYGQVDFISAEEPVAITDASEPVFPAAATPNKQLQSLKGKIERLWSYVQELSEQGEDEKAAEVERLMNPSTPSYEIDVSSQQRVGDKKYQQMLTILMSIHLLKVALVSKERNQIDSLLSQPPSTIPQELSPGFAPEEKLEGQETVASYYSGDLLQEAKEEIQQNTLTLNQYIKDLRQRGEKAKADEVETLMTPSTSAYDIYLASKNRKEDEKFQEMARLLRDNVILRKGIGP